MNEIRRRVGGSKGEGGAFSYMWRNTSLNMFGNGVF